MRTVEDGFGKAHAPEGALWGAATARSLANFDIGPEKVPLPVIHALAAVKHAMAQANMELAGFCSEKAQAIMAAAECIQTGGQDAQFPLCVWQTGSGTQSNMNVNEVIAGLAARQGVELHPNDDVNRGQSTNDAFPTALHIAVAQGVTGQLLPALKTLCATLERLGQEHSGLVKLGRTHLQDAVPITLGQEFCGWAAALKNGGAAVEAALGGVYRLALGGTAVGTGLNAAPGVPERAIQLLSAMYGLPFTPEGSRFAGLNSRGALAVLHGAIKALAADLYRIANDIRLLASGPRGGLGELILPANEAGSSIMPGKVNPTQCEAMCMVCIQVIANDTAVGMAASQGQLELNANLPLLAHAALQSISLLAGAMRSFEARCVRGIRPNQRRIAQHLESSLMLVTALAPALGYDSAAEIAKTAEKQDITLKEAAVRLGYMSAEEFEKIADPKKMV